MRPTSYPLSRGFTLVELSIVIVIIGLIVGGIVGGKSLMDQAKLSRLISDVNRYKVGFNTFKDKYDARPGDFTEGYAYWNGKAGCTINDTTPSGCNGDGNGSYAPWAFDSYRAWKHLEYAEMVPPGNYYYSGAIHPTIYRLYGSPGSKNYFYFFTNDLYSTSAGAPLNNHNGSTITLGQHDGSRPASPVLSPVQASAVDAKMDDGKAQSGMMMGQDAPDNATAICISGGNYVLSDDTPQCRIVWYLE